MQRAFPLSSKNNDCKSRVKAMSENEDDYTVSAAEYRLSLLRKNKLTVAIQAVLLRMIARARAQETNP